MASYYSQWAEAGLIKTEGTQPSLAGKGIRGEVPAHLHLIHNFRFNEHGEIAHVRIAYDEGCLLD